LSALRSKEYAHDYRYFPEPDLVPILPTADMLNRARDALPELPLERSERLERDLGLPSEQARMLAYRSELGDFFEQAVAAANGGGDARTLANWVANELVALLGDSEPQESKLEPPALARLVAMVGAGEVSGNAAKEVLGVLVAEGGDPAGIVADRGLAKAGGDELGEIVDKALADNQDAVEKIRGGNEKAIGAIVGAVMRETKGRADGSEVQRLIQERIGA
jgi:aspartyl-tRNA(Asn)/glutamyl-tRNA(Gln) amidotransferase subunit B